MGFVLSWCGHLMSSVCSGGLFRATGETTHRYCLCRSSICLADYLRERSSLWNCASRQEAPYILEVPFSVNGAHSGCFSGVVSTAFNLSGQRAARYLQSSKGPLQGQQPRLVIASILSVRCAASLSNPPDNEGNICKYCKTPTRRRLAIYCRNCGHVLPPQYDSYKPLGYSFFDLLELYVPNNLQLAHPEFPTLLARVKFPYPRKRLNEMLLASSSTCGSPNVELNSLELNAKHKELQKLLHPDRNLPADEEEKSWKDEHRKQVALAVATLRCPGKRVLHLLRKHVGCLPDDVEEEELERVTDVDLLNEILELNEALKEVRTRDELNALEKKVRHILKVDEEALAANFQEKDIDGVKRTAQRYKMHAGFLDHLKNWSADDIL